MSEIRHRLTVLAEPSHVSRAMAGAGLFRSFGANLRDAATVVRTEEGLRIAWQCTEGRHAWRGTDVVVELVQEGRATVLRLCHRGWSADPDAVADCTMEWGRALLALKAHVEMPDPDDLD
jgi:hypothetical protein